MQIMNSPELIARLALGSIISKGLADRMLDTMTDAPQVIKNDVKPVLLSEDDIAE